MSQHQIDILQRALLREKAARKQAEKILEDKSRELYVTSQELKESNDKLEDLLDEKRSQLRGVFENINDAYLVINTKGKVLKMNDVAIDLFGYNVEKERLNVISLIYKEDYKYAMSSFNQLLTKGKFTNYTARVITKNKNVLWVHINASVIYDNKKQPIAAQGIVRNITENKKTRAFIEAQKEQLDITVKALEKSNDELQEYAHIVSHDLKSPLRSINALTAWIKEDNKGKLDEPSLQNLGLIETTLEKMEHLISDILEYSSVGNTADDTQKVNLNTLVEDLKKVLYVPENISIKIVDKLPTIKGDRVKFQQVFQNLISNAVKFNDKDKGLIEIGYLEHTSYYQFSVKDNGIGIEKKYHKKIFKIFNSLKNSKDSTGIGLSIVKKIINVYQGEIWLESTLNEGTTFHFTIKK